MATDVIAVEQRLHHNHQLLLQQFDQHAADQQRQALAVLDDEVDDEAIAAIRQQLASQHGKLEARLSDIKRTKLLTAASHHPQQRQAAPSTAQAASASSPTSHLYLSQQILQLLDAATHLLGDKQTAINTLVNLIAQQTPNTASLHTPADTQPTSSTLQLPTVTAQPSPQPLTIDLWRAVDRRSVDASPAESPSSTRAQLSSTRVSTAPSSPSPTRSPPDSPTRSTTPPTQPSPLASPHPDQPYIHPSLLASPPYRPAQRPLPPSPHPPSPNKPINVRLRKSFSYAHSPLHSPEPHTEPQRRTQQAVPSGQSPLTVRRLEGGDEDGAEVLLGGRREVVERYDKYRQEDEQEQALKRQQQRAANERKVDWKGDLSSELEEQGSTPPQSQPSQQQYEKPTHTDVQPIDVILSRSALSSSTSSRTERRPLRPFNKSVAATTSAKSAKQKQPASSSIKSTTTSSSSARTVNTFSVPASYAHRTSHPTASSSLSATLTSRKQQYRQHRDQSAIVAAQHAMSRAFDIQASAKSASMKRREAEDDRRRRLEVERSRAQEDERRQAHAAHVRRMRREEDDKRRRREERDRQREAMSASTQMQERQRLRDERQRREQEEEEDENHQQQQSTQQSQSRNSRSFDSHRLERLLRDASMTRAESRGRREAALRELAERSVHDRSIVDVEREERRRAVFNEEWTERMLREMMEEYQINPGRAM